MSAKTQPKNEDLNEEQKESKDPTVWVEEHGDYLFRIARSRVNSRELAEDLVQETFLAAVRGAENFEGRSSVRTWLVGILKNKIIDYIRKKSRTEKHEVAMDDPEEMQRNFNSLGIWTSFLSNWAKSPDKALEDQELFAVLEKCIQKLPGKAKEVFLLRTFEQIDSEEICNVLNISSSNLWVLLHRARLKLRDCIEMNWANAR